MGHISHEPSMEEILSSIKRIIAEDGDVPTGARGRRGGERRAAPRHDEGETPDAGLQAVEDEADDSEILELTDELPSVPPEEVEEQIEAVAELAPAPAPEPVHMEADEMIDEDLVSTTAAKASRQALASLSKMLVKPETPAADNTLEGLVRDMLRPMLKDWLDANLPDLVQAMVAKEIAKISGKGL